MHIRRLVPLFLIVGFVAQLGSPAGAFAYAYRGNCNSAGNYTWDINRYYRSNLNGVEMDQYTIPASTSWAVCTYAGSGGFGHLAELDSLQGTGQQIVQEGIAEFAGSGGTGWQFIYTPNDSSGGQVVNAASLFGENPVAGRTYWFHIQSYYVGPYWSWTYCMKDFSTNHQACWDVAGTWHTAGFAWFAGETADLNDTMGARPETSAFDTFAMRGSDATSGWLGWLSDSQITSGCSGSGYNRLIVNCNVQDEWGYPGAFIWNQ